MSKYLCQGCEFNILGWCKKYGIYGLKSKKIKECESCAHDVPVPSLAETNGEIVKNKRSDNKWIMILKYLLKK